MVRLGETVETNRMSWDEYFMYQALLLSQRATCERLKVGAVLVKENRVIAGGYNGGISGVDDHCIDEGCFMQEGHCVRTIHAEANALLQCAKFGSSTENTTVYVTHFPCLQCTKQLIQAGVKEICYLNNYRNNEYAEHLYGVTGVNVRKIEVEDKHLLELEGNIKKSKEDE